MYWNITPVVKENERDVVVELQWGWTAGMSEKDLENYADDAPRGWDSVSTTLDMAEELRDKLTLIIDANKQRHEEKRVEFNRKLDERFPNLTQQMLEYIERKKNESNNNAS